MAKNFPVVRRSRAVMKWSLGIIVLTFAAGLLSARDNDPETPGATVTAGQITAGQIIENPNNFVGKTVTVTGNVEELHGPRAFEMDSGVNLGELLVLGKDPFPLVPDAAWNRPYLVDDTATVTGTVRMMMAAEIEREFGWDLIPELEAELDRRKPVLIAQSLSFAARRAAAGPTPVPGLPAEVQDFMQFVKEMGPAQAGLKHGYTSTGITRLRAALAAMVNRADIRDQNAEQKLSLLSQRAGALPDDPASLSHADMTRQAFIAAADLMAAMQQKRYPNLSAQVTQVRQAAEDINAKQNLLDQTGKVETFFQRAGDALQAMAQ